jgi:ADP-heptose:LPS heptosyltransferase
MSESRLPAIVIYYGLTGHRATEVLDKPYLRRIRPKLAKVFRRVAQTWRRHNWNHMIRFRSILRAWLGRAEREIFLRLPTLAAALLCRQLRRKKRSSSEQAILIVRLDGIGDCVMTLPLLEQLRTCFPAAVLTLIVQPATEPLFVGNPFVDEVLVLRPWRVHRLLQRFADLCAAASLFWRSLRGRYFDITIDPRWDVDISLATFLCALTRTPLTVGYEDATSPLKLKQNRGFQGAYNLVLSAGPLQHEVLRNMAIARELGCENRDLRPRLNIAPEQRAAAKAWLGQPAAGVRIALGLPAAAPKRRWNAEKYISLLQLLEAKGEFTPIIFADKDTAPLADSIRNAFPKARLAADLTLLQVAAVLAECEVFIGSDSGLAHIAAAVGCKTIALSPHPQGADLEHHNSPVRFRPYAKGALVLQPVAARAGCEAGCESMEPHCILEIDPERAVEAVVRIMDITATG